MTRRDELNARLEAIKGQRFFLAMKDRWNRDDYRVDDKLSREAMNIKEELKKM